MKNVTIFDSTLRDGAQAEGISFSVADKIKITKALDELGVSFVEAGNPGSNQKDLEFFKAIKNERLLHTKVVAFGSTRRCGISVLEDANLNALLSAETEVVCIFGKSWDFQVTDIIKTTLEENLKMIFESIEYLKSKGKTVYFDAEHFFDGYKSNPNYAIEVLISAEKAGAAGVILCDTKGGCFPNEIYEIVSNVKKKINISVGIHTHNDQGMAVANSVMAVMAGADHVQGTLLGYGERCGNANLSAIIPSLQIKMNYKCLPDECLKQLTSISKYVAEVSNIKMNHQLPYVGSSAFAHKAGMHIDGVQKAPQSFENISPELVGNERKFLISEVAGRSTILSKVQKLYPEVTKTDPVIQTIVDKVKALEYEGYQFEGADASFELLIHKIMGKYHPFFELDSFKIIGECPSIKNEFSASAIIKIKVGEKEEMTAASGDGPVDALNKALRKALEMFYPELKDIHLSDYKVRVLDGSSSATAAMTRVLIESTDGKTSWSTMGVSRDILDASFKALVDSMEYRLLKIKEE